MGCKMHYNLFHHNSNTHAHHAHTPQAHTPQAHTPHSTHPTSTHTTQHTPHKHTHTYTASIMPTLEEQVGDTLEEKSDHQTYQHKKEGRHM